MSTLMMCVSNFGGLYNVLACTFKLVLVVIWQKNNLNLIN